MNSCENMLSIIASVSERTAKNFWQMQGYMARYNLRQHLMFRMFSSAAALLCHFQRSPPPSSRVVCLDEQESMEKDGVRNAKAQHELNLIAVLKGNKKHFQIPYPILFCLYQLNLQDVFQLSFPFPQTLPVSIIPCSILFPWTVFPLPSSCIPD